MARSRCQTSKAWDSARKKTVTNKSIRSKLSALTDSAKDDKNYDMSIEI